LRNRQQSAAVVTANYDFSMWLGNMISRAGYAPEALDALPCALARASEMFLRGADHPCLMVHIGDACTTLTLVHQGLPILTRVLNHHGFEKMLVPLASEFAISPAEVNLLLMKAATEGSRQMESPNELMEIVSEFQLRFVQSLAGEVYRTLEYIRAEHGNSEPSGILLCGNGSITPMLSLQFEQLLETPTETWSLAGSEQVERGMPVSLYAVAAGLSAIAWEEN
jgi:Tfp pilus assembly PilM family ATPase